MITTQDMLNLKQRLKVGWKEIMPDAQSVAVWRDTFKDYDYGTVEQAIIDYMSNHVFKPTPADIKKCIPAPVADTKKDIPKFTPRYETLPNGKLARVYKCRRCRDTGLVTWENEKQECFGAWCNCEAAVANYGKRVLEGISK